MLFSVLILPLAFVAVLIYLLLKKRYRGLLLSLAMFVATVLVGLWAIFQSRSSTAAIGILFLPFYGIFAAGMGLLSANLRSSQRKALRSLGWFCLAVALAVPLFLGYQGFASIALNASRDAQHKANLAEIERNKRVIADALGRNPGRESEIINTLIGEHASERNFLLPVLDSKFVSPDALDSLARSDDLGIALSAVRNPNCRPATLERIYRTHTNPDYFFQALAAHENTPPEILIDLYRRPVTIYGLDRFLASNPAVPKEILREIATTTRESFVIQRLLQNPKLDCALLGPITDALQGSERENDSYSVARLQELKSGQCKFSSGTR
jgi:hypothetical protein